MACRAEGVEHGFDLLSVEADGLLHVPADARSIAEVPEDNFGFTRGVPLDVDLDLTVLLGRSLFRGQIRSGPLGASRLGVV